MIIPLRCRNNKYLLFLNNKTNGCHLLFDRPSDCREKISFHFPFLTTRIAVATLAATSKGHAAALLGKGGKKVTVIFEYVHGSCM